MSLLSEIADLLNHELQLKTHLVPEDAAYPLLGNVPELDSMSVVSVINALEKKYDFMVDDDDIDAEVFATLGDLAEFVARNVSAVREQG